MGYCIDSIYSGQAAVRSQPLDRARTLNASRHRAREGPLKKFVVVGAGPAGLEAARVAGVRGHKVTLFEAADRPGGQVRVAAGLARRREIMGIVDWRVAQCAKYDVSLMTNVYAEAATVVDENPERGCDRDGRGAQPWVSRRRRGTGDLWLGRAYRRRQARRLGHRL